MKKVLAAFVVIAIATLAGCGDNSSAHAPAAPAGIPDRTLTLETSKPAFLKSGIMSVDVSGVAASSDGVGLSVPVIPVGTLGLALTDADPLKSSISVLPNATNGFYAAKLVFQHVPPGTYKIKAVSFGNAPAFKTYSTSLNYNVN